MGGEKLKASQSFNGRKPLIIFLFLVFFCGFAVLPAQNQLEDESPALIPVPLVDESSIILGETALDPLTESESSIFVMLRMILVLALAALAIYGVVFFIKRLSKPQEGTDPNLRVLAKIPITNDTFAAVIAVGPKAWLVGGSSGGIRLISEIDDQESLETMLIENSIKMAEAESRQNLSFKSLLGRLGGGKNTVGDLTGGSSSGTENSSFAENLRKKRERLKGSQ